MTEQEVVHGTQPKGNPEVQHGTQPQAAATVQVEPNGGVVADVTPVHPEPGQEAPGGTEAPVEPAEQPSEPEQPEQPAEQPAEPAEQPESD